MALSRGRGVVEFEEDLTVVGTVRARVDAHDRLLPRHFKANPPMTAMQIRAALSQLTRHPELREQIAAFASHFLLNLSLFAVVIAASVILAPAEFAHFSLANNYIMLGAMLMDMGLNTAALKLAIEGDRRDFLDINLALKTFFFLFATALLAVVTLFAGPQRELVILSCSAGLACWYATRCIEQYRRLFWRYASLNLQLSVSRIVVGGLSLATGSWAFIALSIHVLALLPISAATIAQLVRRSDLLKSLWPRSTLTILFRAAPAYFLTAVLYSSIPAIAQTAIYLRNDIAATGAFGIVVLLVGPISLLTNTLRIYLQPQIMLKDLSDVDVFGLGRGSLRIVAGAYFSILLLSILPASLLVGWFYADRYPQAGLYLLIFGSACCVVDALGFYNMRVLRGNLINLGLAVNAARALFAAFPLLYDGLAPLAIVAWTAVVVVIGELALFIILNIVEKREDVPS